MGCFRVLAIAVLAIGLGIGLSLPVEAATATWDRSPDPTVVGYRLSYGTQSGVHGTSLDVGDVVSHVFFPPPGQRYYIVVQALDSTGALSSKSAEVVFDAPSSGGSTPSADPTNAPAETFNWSVGDTDAPVGGDFDGDGRADPATYRSATGEWRLWPSASNFIVTAPIGWGIGTDIPVPADYDGDRRTDIAVYRPSTGVWHVLLSTTNMQWSLEIQWGNSTDRPVPLDYDNDGRADLALSRFGGFEILLSSTNYSSSITVR